MKIHILELSLDEFRDALMDYAEKHAKSQPDVINVESYGTTRIVVELRPGGFVDASEFRHRTKAAT